ncbi:cytochrome P450, partial [Marasmius fiardii PR-910]
QEEILVISDPRAAHAILHNSVEDYPETGDMKRVTDIALGRGVFWATGRDHTRHRKILNPAFSMNHLKQFLPLFQRHLSEKWTDQVQHKSQTFNILPWLHSLALDILGAFNYRFGALDSETNELMTLINELEYVGLLTALLVPSADLGSLALQRSCPSSITSFRAAYFPVSQEKLAHRFQWLAQEKGREAMEGLEGSALVGKDILSILVRANAEEDVKKRLSESEVLAQISTLIQAGNHTIGQSVSWILYELAAHPEDQRMVYKEIKRVRGTKTGELSSSDYDSMVHLTAVIKETLRLRPNVPILERTALKSDVLSLDFPVASIAGHKIDYILIKKGQRIMIDVASYQRLESIWGADPDRWDPSRHTRVQLSEVNKTTPVGLFGNLLTFSSGPKGCLGRVSFSVMEIQVIVTGLLEKFEFGIAPGVEVRPMTMLTLFPAIKGREMEGPKLPLTVKPRSIASTEAVAFI